MKNYDVLYRRQLLDILLCSQALHVVFTVVADKQKLGIISYTKCFTGIEKAFISDHS